MDVIKINGVAIKTPTEMSFTLQDYDSENSKRSLSGKMTRDRIRANTRKFKLSFSLLSGEELSKILNAITPQFFNVTILDPLTNTVKTFEMYAGDKSFDVKQVKVNGKIKYNGLSFSLIER